MDDIMPQLHSGSLPCFEVVSENRTKFISDEFSMRKCDNRHWHRSFQLWYIKDGEMDLALDEITINLKEGDLFLIPPYLAHNVDSTHSSHIFAHSISFSDSFINSPESPFFSYGINEPILDYVRIPFFYSFKGEDKAMADELCKKIMAEYENRDLCSYDDVKAALLTLLRRMKPEGAPTVTKHEIELMQEKRKAIDTAINYMQEHYAEKLSAEKLATKVALSRCVFFSLFKKICGRTFSDYLKRLRIKHVTDLIFLDRTISEIAYDSGFSDSSHLIHTVKELLDITPTKFRETALSWQKDFGEPEYQKFIERFGWTEERE